MQFLKALHLCLFSAQNLMVVVNRTTPPTSLRGERRIMDQTIGGQSVEFISSHDPLPVQLTALAQSVRMQIMIECPGSPSTSKGILNRFGMSIRVTEAGETFLDQMTEVARDMSSMTPEELLARRQGVNAIVAATPESTVRRIVHLVRSARPHSPEFAAANSCGFNNAGSTLDVDVIDGPPPRGSQALLKTAAANAMMAGRDAIADADVLEHFRAVLSHRIEVRPGADREAVLERLLGNLELGFRISAS